eukprot:TRINITY_DN21480_c0_g1_i1.p1 TRINITY_DN21480_c0_g1~~TRINITY_DN21480_c0_g1_i1.p1  ORF type:complete len:962 (-),score=266.88 TRINITY_DN21480_c0_g1_i1:38-2923(-)
MIENTARRQPSANFLEKVNQKREDAKKRGKDINCKPGEVLRLVCPSCLKPNVLTTTFCTGCTFPLCEWDIQAISENPFLDLARGKDTGTYIYLRTPTLLVAEDMFGVSWTSHMQAIPVQEIEDIRFLTKAHIPLLQSLYEAVVGEAEKLEVPFTEHNSIEEVALIGFNFPVSIKQLHLHLILPPYKHSKISEYPRWHSYEKVIKDLEQFGKVITYDVQPIPADGAAIDQKVKLLHSIYGYMVIEKMYEEEWNKWFAENEKTTLLWSYIDSTLEEIGLVVGENEVKIKYPDPKDPESVFFLSSDSPISWLDYVQDWLTEQKKVTFTDLLNKINKEIKDNIKKKRKKSSEPDYDVELVEEEDNYELEMDPYSQMDWTEIEKKNYCQRLVYKEFKIAQNLLGPSFIVARGSGSVELKINIDDVLEPSTAEALELSRENLWVDFNFNDIWAFSAESRIPLPLFKTRQANCVSSSWGVVHHIKEIVLRYLEDNWKWSQKMDLNLGVFTSTTTKVDQSFEMWKKERKKELKDRAKDPKNPFPVIQDTKTTPLQDNSQAHHVLLAELCAMGFKKDSVEKALKDCNMNKQKAIDALLKMGPSATEPPPVKVPDELLVQLTSMGFEPNDATKALIDSNMDFDVAYVLLISQQEQIASNQKQTTNKPKSTEVYQPDDYNSVLCSSNTNLFLGVSSYVRMRLAAYMQFCMICHKKHRCHSEKPIVCCNPLCIFRYSDLLPDSKKERIRQLSRITICPFKSCESSGDYIDTDTAILATISNNVDFGVPNNQQNMLDMYAHRYLPNKEVIDFIEKGVKTHNKQIVSIENVLKPELVIAYEKAWERLKKSRPATESTPHIAYHGTSADRIDSILEKGLLVPGKGLGKNVTHSTDTGWWGGGIYLSPNPGLSIAYMRTGNKLLMCSVLMGKRFQCTVQIHGADLKEGYDSHMDPSGNEWIIFDPGQVLPCYLITFK